MKAKDCKITVSGVEIKGIGSRTFDTFENDEDNNYFSDRADAFLKYVDKMKQDEFFEDKTGERK